MSNYIPEFLSNNKNINFNDQNKIANDFYQKGKDKDKNLISESNIEKLKFIYSKNDNYSKLKNIESKIKNNEKQFLTLEKIKNKNENEKNYQLLKLLYLKINQNNKQQFILNYLNPSFKIDQKINFLSETYKNFINKKITLNTFERLNKILLSSKTKTDEECTTEILNLYRQKFSSNNNISEKTLMKKVFHFLYSNTRPIIFGLTFSMTLFLVPALVQYSSITPFTSLSNFSEVLSTIAINKFPTLVTGFFLKTSLVMGVKLLSERTFNELEKIPKIKKIFNKKIHLSFLNDLLKKMGINKPQDYTSFTTRDILSLITQEAASFSYSAAESGLLGKGAKGFLENVGAINPPKIIIRPDGSIVPQIQPNVYDILNNYITSKIIVSGIILILTKGFLITKSSIINTVSILRNIPNKIFELLTSGKFKINNILALVNVLDKDTKAEMKESIKNNEKIEKEEENKTEIIYNSNPLINVFDENNYVNKELTSKNIILKNEELLKMISKNNSITIIKEKKEDDDEIQIDKNDPIKIISKGNKYIEEETIQEIKEIIVENKNLLATSTIVGIIVLFTSTTDEKYLKNY